VRFFLLWIGVVLLFVSMSGCYPHMVTTQPRLEGCVRDAHTQRPVSDASIGFVKYRDGEPYHAPVTSTDKKGCFIVAKKRQLFIVPLIPMDPPMFTGLSVSHPKYLQYSQKVPLEHPATDLEIFLNPVKPLTFP